MGLVAGYGRASFCHAREHSIDLRRTTVAGGLTSASVHAVMKEHAYPHISEWSDASFDADPSLEATLVVELTIAPAGAGTKARATFGRKGADAGAPRSLERLTRALEGLTFERSPTGGPRA